MSQIPFLCGGTFFLLLVEAKAKSRPKRDSVVGVKDSVSQKNMLAGLIRQFDSGFKPPSQGRTFDTDQSAYRSCDKPSLPFYDQQLVDAYDEKVRCRFTDALNSMREYAEYYLHAESKEKMDWLGKALLTLLKDDQQSNGDRFFYCDGGMTKERLLSLDHIYMPSLLLALWHYILINRPDNSLGRPTFEAWNEKQGETGDKWTFVSKIGKSYPREVKFDFHPDNVETNEGAEDDAGEANAEEDVIEPEVMEEETEQDGAKVLHQTVMINNGPGPQIKEHHGDIVINIH